MREIPLPVNIPNLVQSFDLGRESSVETEDGAVDNSREREALEDLCEPFPDGVAVVLLVALVVEAVEFIDFFVLVVAPEDGYPVLMLDFEEKNVEEGFH